MFLIHQVDFYRKNDARNSLQDSNLLDYYISTDDSLNQMQDACIAQ